jgi:DNA primase
MSIDFDAIRARHPLLSHLQTIGIGLRRQGKCYVGKCPLHHERNGASFIVKGERWRCWGKCQTHGDVIDFEQHYFGLPGIAEAARHLGGEELPSRDVPIPRPSAPPPKQPHVLTKRDRDRMAHAAHTLAQKPTLMATVLGDRPEFSLAAIHDIALEGDLGFEDGAILFGYAHGIKARRKARSNGDRPIYWLCGGAGGQCWRQSLLRAEHARVYITEGETDAIALLSLGLEEGGVLVIALASASTLPEPEPFTGKDLIIIPDPDAAGRRAAARLRDRCGPYARGIAIVEEGGDDE